MLINQWGLWEAADSNPGDSGDQCYYNWVGPGTRAAAPTGMYAAAKREDCQDMSHNHVWGFQCALGGFLPWQCPWGDRYTRGCAYWM